MNKKILGVVVMLFIWLGLSFASASRLSEIMQYHFQYSSVNWIKSSKTDTKNITTDLWYLLSQSDNYLKQDIAKLLDNEATRKTNLNAYIVDGNSLISALGYQKNKLNNDLEKTATKIQTCQNQLTTANQKYVTSLNNRNEMQFKQSVESAKQAKRCIWEEQVNQSAIKSLLQQVQQYSTKIEKRHSYLRSNQSLIIRHYDILKPSLLKELYSIAVQLES